MLLPASPFLIHYWRLLVLNGIIIFSCCNLPSLKLVGIPHVAVLLPTITVMRLLTIMPDHDGADIRKLGLRFTYQRSQIKMYCAWTSPPQKKKIQKIFFSGKYHVKFEHFVNLSDMYFRAKMFCPPGFDHVTRLPVLLAGWDMGRTSRISCLWWFLAMLNDQYL